MAVTSPDRSRTGRQLARCATTVVTLLRGRHLHVERRRVREAQLPDGRRLHVFRQTSCDLAGDDDLVVLVVWFHLRGMPAGARLRRWTFERESILNTLLYAGFEGFRTKLWLVDRTTCDYAGLYEWNGTGAAERYARYICAVLRPLSRPGSVGFQLLPGRTLDDVLAPSCPSSRP